MTANPGPKAFISSSVYDLLDLRASLEVFLKSSGLEPVASNRLGFGEDPKHFPYASCLTVLEGCQIVIGIIGRRFGNKFPTGWGEYAAQYRDYTPTQAEIAHAFKKNKRLIVYVLSDVLCHYEIWRKTPDSFDQMTMNGYDNFNETMKLITWVKNLKGDDRPPLWILPYSDVQMIIHDLRKRFAMDLQIMWSHFESSAAKHAMILALGMMDNNLPDNFVDCIVDDLENTELGKVLLETLEEHDNILKNKKEVEKSIKEPPCRKDKEGELSYAYTQCADIYALEKALKEQFLLQKIIPALEKVHELNDYVKKPPASVEDLWTEVLSRISQSQPAR